GDVKLAVLLGLWLGVISPLLPAYALIASSVLGVIVGVGILAVRRESKPFPFGPWLAIGTIVVVLLSNPILRWAGLDGNDEDVARVDRKASLVVEVGR